MVMTSPLKVTDCDDEIAILRVGGSTPLLFTAYRTSTM
jgi:hypothetical protein